MRALVTGGSGFVGSYLVERLRRAGAEVVGTTTAPAHERFVPMDLRDPASVDDVVRRAAPDRIWHLAAQSRAARSWQDPASTYEVNVTGTHFVLESVRRWAPEARVLVAASSDAYGMADPAAAPFTEETPLRPVSPYGASKAAQESVGRMFADAHGMHVVSTRAFYHVGPGQSPVLAIAGWARHIARAEIGLAPTEMGVGNLELVRDVGDVRDFVRAYLAALEHGAPGETYNVATGTGRRLGDILDALVARSSIGISVRVDPALMRPADPPVLTGSAAKLEKISGWRPRIPLEDTLAGMLEGWRSATRTEVALQGKLP